jgi:hypothetical protein
MTTGKVTRKPGGMTMLGGKLVEAAECVEIDYGKQGVSRAYVVLAAPLSPEAKKEKQERIFQRFYQADASHATSGNGGGLAIVERIVDLHRGEISVVGESTNTARYVGIKVEKVILRTLILSGAICGFAGLLLVAGTNHTLTTTLAGGRGFTAVMVAWLAKFNPLVMIASSFLLVFMGSGAGEISTAFGLNHAFGDILTGIILFFIIGCEFFITYKLNFVKEEGDR